MISSIMFRFHASCGVVAREWKGVVIGGIRTERSRIVTSRYLRQSAATTAIRFYHRTNNRDHRPVLQDLSDTEIVCIWNNGTVCMMGDDMISQGPLIVERLRKILPKNKEVSVISAYLLCQCCLDLSFLTWEYVKRCKKRQ